MLRIPKLINKALLVAFAALLVPSLSNAILALEGGTFSVQGGALFPDKMGTVTIGDGSSKTLEFNTGYVGSIGMGLKSGPIRYEGEFNFLYSKVKTSKLSGTAYILNAMYNMYYDFESVGIDLIPYLGGGAGYAYVNPSIKDTTAASGTSDKLFTKGIHTGAFQAKVGLNYLMSETVSWTLGYRYFRTLELSKLNNKPFLVHQVALGVIWYLG